MRILRGVLRLFPILAFTVKMKKTSLTEGSLRVYNYYKSKRSSCPSCRGWSGIRRLNDMFSNVSFLWMLKTTDVHIHNYYSADIILNKSHEEPS